MPDELDQNLGIEESPEQVYAREIRKKYRAVFGYSLGQEILRDILITCHFGMTLDPDNKVMVAEYNVGIVIAEKAGFLDRISEILGVQT
jgi:hypothetical protein